MTSEHTPGPWVHGGRYGLDKIEIQAGSRAVATVWAFRAPSQPPDGRKAHIRDDFQADPEGFANLALIVQAPALLEVVEGLSSVLTTMNRDYQPEDIWKLLDGWNEAAREVLARVRASEEVVAS